MLTKFLVLIVEPAQRLDQEPLGSKEKFWVSRDDGLWLFKFARDNTGEDWAEKLAAEFAHALGIDAPRIELASFDGRRGCICKSFIDRDEGETLIHGNEVLSGQMHGYDSTKVHRQSSHTIENILAALHGVFKAQQAFDAAVRKLGSYLVLDGLIGNTDRHHENWGLKHSPAGLEVAPSFDHASSLGRENRDERCRHILLDPNGIDRYIRRGHGGIYSEEDDSRGASPLALLIDTAVRNPAYFQGWSTRLQSLTKQRIEMMTERIPPNLASDVAKQFIVSMVVAARTILMQELK